MLGCGLLLSGLEDALSVNRRFPVLHTSVHGHGKDDVVAKFFGEQRMDIALGLRPCVTIAYHDAQELQLWIEALLDLIPCAGEGLKALYIIAQGKDGDDMPVGGNETRCHEKAKLGRVDHNGIEAAAEGLKRVFEASPGDPEQGPGAHQSARQSHRGSPWRAF